MEAKQVFFFMVLMLAMFVAGFYATASQGGTWLIFGFVAFFGLIVGVAAAFDL